MFYAIRNRMVTLLNKPGLYDQVIFTTTTTGTVMGGIMATSDTFINTDIITNSIIGCVVGGGIGVLVGLGSPFLIPMTAVGGTIGIAKLGYDKIEKI